MRQKRKKKEAFPVNYQTPGPRYAIRRFHISSLSLTLALYMVYLAFDMVGTPILLASRLDAFAPWWLRC